MSQSTQVLSPIYAWGAALSGLLAICVLLLWPAMVQAASNEPLGKSTEAWMALQKEQKPSGKESISGEQASLIWERHLNSFGREIPETLQDRRAISSGGGQR